MWARAAICPIIGAQKLRRRKPSQALNYVPLVVYAHHPAVLGISARRSLV